MAGESVNKLSDDEDNYRSASDISRETPYHKSVHRWSFQKKIRKLASNASKALRVALCLIKPNMLIL